MTDEGSGQVAGANHENLSSRTFRGIKWTYASAAATGVIQITYSVTMSRLLDDSTFGLVALAQVVVNFGLYFAQLGVGRAIMQKRVLDELDVRAAFSSAVVLGLVAAGILVAAAPTLAWVFDDQRLVGVMRAMSLTFVLLGLGSTAEALLFRELRFRELAIVDVPAFLVGYLIVGIGCAVAGLGVYSLVLAALTTQAISSVVAYLVVRHPVRPTADGARYRQLYAFGSRASAVQILEFFGNNLDTVAAGRYVSAGLLGQYNRAFYLVSLPMEYLVQNVSGVLFPSLSTLQDDQPRLRAAYTGILTVVAATMIPMCVGLAIAAPEVVGVVFGPGWEQAARVVPFIALAAAGKILSRLPSIAAEAMAQLNAKLWVELASVAVLVGLLAMAAGGELIGYARALAVSEVARHAMYLLIQRTTIGLRARDIAAAYRPMVVTCTAVAAGIAAARVGLLPLDAPIGVVFAAEVVAGAVCLGAALRFGPTAAVRQEIAARLHHAGVLSPGSARMRRLAGILLGPAANVSCDPDGG